MKKSKFKWSPIPVARWLAMSAVGLTLAACAPGVLMGDLPSDPPPQLAMLGAKDAKGHEYMTWENPGSFGKVPADRKAAGDITCMKLAMNLRAQGYHPRALNVRGQPFPGGAYYCQLALEAVVGQNPPQVVLNDGKLVWNDPGAFGPIDEADLSKAQAACKQQNPKFIPLGYHPQPLDVNGRTIAGGAFLCVE